MKYISGLFITMVFLTSLGWSVGQTDIAYVPYTISTPGSYIMVKDLYAAPNINAITIATSDISIDLNGHTLYGAGTTAASGYGIYGSLDYPKSIIIKNGTIQNFKNSGIYISSGYASNGANPVQVHNITLRDNGDYGICIGGYMLCYDCIATNNGQVGIYGGTGSLIRNNICNYNKNGIESGFNSSVIGNQIYNNSATGLHIDANSFAKDNNINGNQQTGISASARCVITGNNISLNGGIGLEITYRDNMIQNNAIYSNTTGMYIDNIGNFHGGNIIHNNTLNTSIYSLNTTGDGINGGPADLVY